MTALRRAAGFGLVAVMILPGASSPALGNGDVQREIEGRVISVDAGARTLVVAREFRGKTVRLTLRAGGLLVLVDSQRGGRLRLEVNRETEVLVCRSGAALDALGPGGLVRVKYVDRAGAEPQAQSILLLRR